MAFRVNEESGAARTAFHAGKHCTSGRAGNDTLFDGRDGRTETTT